jgi:hypothetical protein
MRQNLEQAQLEREEMRKFLKWMLDNDRVPKGLKALIAEALQGHYWHKVDPHTRKIAFLGRIEVARFRSAWILGNNRPTSAKPVGAGVVSQPSIPAGKQSLLRMLTATTESVSLCVRMKSWLRLWNLIRRFALAISFGNLCDV